METILKTGTFLAILLVVAFIIERDVEAGLVAAAFLSPVIVWLFDPVWFRREIIGQRSS